MVQTGPESAAGFARNIRASAGREDNSMFMFVGRRSRRAPPPPPPPLLLLLPTGS
jgi:hypothetical protein